MELLGDSLDIIPEGNILIDFYADWCSPCKFLAPVLDEASKELGIKFFKINIDQNPKLASEFSIASIPTVILFKNKKEVGRMVGLVTKSFLMTEVIRLLGDSNV